MKKSGSPYYLTIPFVSPATAETCTSYTLSIYIWTGLEASVPATATYTVTKNNPTSSTGNDEVNISRIIKPQITFTPLKATSTSLLDSSNQVWVRTEVEYATSDPTDTGLAQLGNTELFSRGYAYGNEGSNTDTPTNKILLSGTEFDIARTSYFSLPIDMEGYDYPTDDAITVISYPDNEINASFTESLTTNSGEVVRYIIVDATETTTDTYIEIVYNSVTITLNIEEECRYTPIDIYFINKEGAQQSLTFFKSNIESMDVTSEQYESDRGQASLGFHQYTKFNIQGKSKFKVNSGFVDEDMNETFKQLLLSERVWKLSNNTFTPLNVNSTNLEYKTRQKDRLINYEITFDYAYNEINNI